MNRHDHYNPDCPKNEPIRLAQHSDGTVYFTCKNCGSFGDTEHFNASFDISEILEQL